MFTKDTIIRVRYAETDQMGVVYHANYFVWFEVGRTAWFRALNMDYRELEKEGIILPVIDVRCQYKKSALYDDELIIRTWLEELKGVRLTFHYQVLRKQGEELLAAGSTMHTFIDKNKKPVRLKKQFPQLWEALNKATK